ncbi:hypothetical protein GQ600_20768 [Phytophthora cactorum]|nr:hypothetical protein GQ600_20768 [Phytophthora cactorum]
MAKRKFVSSKKNAPSRAISSKEAALHRRTAGGDGAESDSGDSAASSDVGSSTPLSSEDEQEEDDDELSASQDVTPMAVEVMPASVGRGKQLRFPTAISRGKSLLSVADSEDEDEDRGLTAMEVDEQPVATLLKDSPAYPIKAVRARKRHRPDSEYYKQMSTYVRDCLLSVRHAGSSETPADAFKDESSPRHEEFRRRLAAGDVERVTWKEPPSVESNTGESRGDQPIEASSSKSSKHSKSSKPSKSSKSSKHSKPAKAAKAAVKAQQKQDSHFGLQGPDTNKSAPSSSNGSTSNLTPPTQSVQEEVEWETSKEEEQERPMKKEKEVKAEDVKQQPEEVKKEPVPAAAPPTPAGYFTITFTPGSDVQKLRLESAKLMDEARKLKHEGTVEARITQGKYYLRSGAKFFEYALKLQEVKVAYQEKNDAQHAHSFGENCVTTLSQTTSLIESTIRAFQSAAPQAAIVLLGAVYTWTLTRVSENGLTPPIDPNSNLNSNSSKDAAIRKHLLKEMEHTLRGFEMWRRYEACKVSVLPRVTNPVILDPAVFFEDLEAELNQS